MAFFLLRLLTSALNNKAKEDKSAVDKVLAKFIISNHTFLEVSEFELQFLVDLSKNIEEFFPYL